MKIYKIAGLSGDNKPITPWQGSWAQSQALASRGVDDFMIKSLDQWLDRVIPLEEIEDTKARMLRWLEAADEEDVKYALNEGWRRVEEMSKTANSNRMKKSASPLEEAQSVANELGWKIIATPGRAIEFQRPNTSPYAGGGNSFFLIRETPEAFQNAIDTMRQEAQQKNNRNKAKELANKVQKTTGEKVRTRGGWHQHTIISFDGKELGRIQIRLRDGRTDTLSCCGGACVRGSDIEWIISEALNQGIVSA